MNKRLARICTLSVLAGVLVLANVAQAVDRMDPIPLKNWKVPDISTAVRTWGDSPNTHFVNPGAWVFQSTVPCRQVDTRTANGTYGGPIFSAGQTRTYNLANQTPTCLSSFPVAMAAVSINITVTQTAGTGFVTGYPTGGALPGVSNITFIGAGVTLSNAAIIPTNGASSINIFASQQTHVIIDINGFFIGNLSETADQLFVRTDLSGGAAILGQNDSSDDGSLGVGGFEGGTGIVFGVQGQVTAGCAEGCAGVHGFGGAFGVRGEGTVNGVRGNATASGSCAICGMSFAGANSSGVTGVQGAGATAALAGFGDLIVSGTKSFVDPDPNDPSRQINYIALEGPTAGTYFTGRATAEGGIARIAVPDHFRAVTDPESLTVQATPIGHLATFAVLKVDLNEIVIKASSDVDFFYTINGIRATHRDHNPIEPNIMFRPDPQGGAGSAALNAFSPAQKRILIQNQVLNPDGTWNRATAERLGWKLDEK
jgi:hypothetical protein